ncbi:ATP-binding protein [uncultured Streptomyces sp.]|uniref:ATP-binding protein n=1 Tax=uncultured Streptomyces sp. TaxID=174707 RepID=UPI00260C0CC4|nr:ATP-binding protein [uncultured Streptomyces sp.]
MSTERTIDGARDDLGEGGTTGPSPNVPADAAAARAVVRTLLDDEFCTLRDVGMDDVVISDAMLVTSELVTNAIRHGGGLTAFSAELTVEGLLLSVSDANPAVPVTVAPRPGAIQIGGYGWPLVHRLCKRVTVTPHSAGKRVSVLVALF